MSATDRPLNGVLLGGTGLIGGTLLHHFEKDTLGAAIRVRAPNSKELSLRVPSDIQRYFRDRKADFIINCAIAELDSDPQMTAEVNCLGAVHLARVAAELGIPYIHVSSGAVMQNGDDVRETDRLGLDDDLANYAKGKLIAERAIETLGKRHGLDYTIVRLGIVYGSHDHKIRGFHRLLYSLVEGALPFLPTRRGARHSYTNARKLPAFVAHLLRRRGEFGRRTYQFVDPDPVRLGDLILAIKQELGIATPFEFYVPHPIARLLLRAIPLVLWLTSRLGID
ncbi:MAG: NAD-dependent epimerase/dehydratase family protein, partial [Myxococcota bacterium]